jgi:hypothetical protein
VSSTCLLRCARCGDAPGGALFPSWEHALSSTVTIRLTGRASRWVSLLQEFGHIDTDGADRLLVAVAELHADMGGADGALVDLPLVRRAAAMLLVPVDPGAEVPPDPQATPAGIPALLDDDWPLFFS